MKNLTAAAMNFHQLRDLMAATTFANGAILVDDFDRLIFDDVLRNYPAFSRIDRRLAPGENTGGFNQTAVSTGRVAPVRNLGYSSTSPTRAARTARAIKAIVANITFGIFDRSVYQQQGRRFGNLEAKDVRDLSTAVLRKWQDLFYNGDSSVTADEFDGLKKILGAGTTIAAASSVVKTLKQGVVDLMNTSARDVRPTAIYTNAQVVEYISQEYLKVGDKLLYAPLALGGLPSIAQVPVFPTAAGFLPLIADPFNGSVAGTPVTYPTFVLTEDQVSWQYVEILGAAGAEPKTFEITLTNALDLQHSTLIFGAVDLLGGTDHHKRYNVEARSTVVDPTS